MKKEKKNCFVVSVTAPKRTRDIIYTYKREKESEGTFCDKTVYESRKIYGRV